MHLCTYTWELRRYSVKPFEQVENRLFFRCLEVNLRADSCFYRHFYRDTLTRGTELKPFSLVWRITELRKFVQTAELRTPIGQCDESPSQQCQCIFFLSSLPSFPSLDTTTTAVFGFQPVIALLLINTVAVRACLSMWLERFRGSQKEDERGPFSIQILSGTSRKLSGRVWAVGGTPRPLKA